MHEIGGLVGETEENPILLEDDAEERRPVAVIDLAATGRLREGFAKALKIVAEFVCSGKTEERFDVGRNSVGLGNEGCCVDNGAHSEEGKLRALTLFGAPLKFGRECPLALQRPPLSDVQEPGLDCLAAFIAAHVLRHFRNIVCEGDWRQYILQCLHMRKHIIDG
jgi:hypothetical protein